MSRIEELNDANIRVVYNDAGDIESLIDNKGRALNIPLVSKDVTGVIKVSSSKQPIFFSPPNERLAGLESWLLPKHLPILSPDEFFGMTTITNGLLSVAHVPNGGDFSNSALRLSASGALSGGNTVEIPLPISTETGPAAVKAKAAGSVHLRVKCSDWSKVTRLYVTFAQRGAFVDRKIWSVVAGGKSMYGTHNPLNSEKWNGVYRTLPKASANFTSTGSPDKWGATNKYFDVTGVQFTLDCTGAVQLDIDRIYSPDWPVGVITPIFDGWYKSAREWATQYLSPLGYGCGGSVNTPGIGDPSPNYADLKPLSDLGFDVFIHGHQNGGATDGALRKQLSLQRRALASSVNGPWGARWHQWLQNNGAYDGKDMAGILKSLGVNASRGSTSDAEWGIDPFNSSYVNGDFVHQYDPWLPYAGRFNRRPMAAYQNMSPGTGYMGAATDTTAPTLFNYVEYAANSAMPIQPYFHQIAEAPSSYDVIPAFATDWLNHIKQNVSAGKLLVLNPTDLERLTFWRSGEVYMRWDGEWVYRADPAKIAF